MYVGLVVHYYIMSDHRKSMSPYHLELLLWLRYHRHWWNAGTIDEIIRKGEYIEKPSDNRGLNENDV